MAARHRGYRRRSETQVRRARRTAKALRTALDRRRHEIAPIRTLARSSAPVLARWIASRSSFGRRLPFTLDIVDLAADHAADGAGSCREFVGQRNAPFGRDLDSRKNLKGEREQEHRPRESPWRRRKLCDTWDGRGAGRRCRARADRRESANTCGSAPECRLCPRYARYRPSIAAAALIHRIGRMRLPPANRL